MSSMNSTAQRHNIPSIALADDQIQRVTSFKLLVATISDGISWDKHGNAIYKKGNKRLHSMQFLKGASESITDVVAYYISFVRPMTRALSDNPA
jgi:hypothetical protein